MCLIAFAVDAHPRYRFALIGNRDEDHARPSAPVGPLPDLPGVYGGRDLEHGGSWLLVSRHGRLAAVTNVRAGLPTAVAPRSRGELVRRFVQETTDADAFCAALRPQAAAYGRFNLLLWDGERTRLATNHPAFATRAPERGVHGLSNGDFDADWPKVRQARTALRDWLARGDGDIEPLFVALHDERPAADEALPDTGVGLALERVLSPPFIRGERYGTRASSVVLIDAAGCDFAERRFASGGVPQGQTRVVLPWDRR